MVKASLLCALYSKSKKIVSKNCVHSPEFDHSGGDLPESDAVNDGHTKEHIRTEDLDLLKPLCTSQLNSKFDASASCSTVQSSTLEAKFVKCDKEVVKLLDFFCEICMENRETRQMFINSVCSHSFCCDCTSKYIETKVQEGVNIITCPAVNCAAVLDSSSCRWMVSEDILVCWDESLCRSLIQESQKLYCPYKDCSIMLVNDSGLDITETKCPICQRMFCAQCQVPWHLEFTCKEFAKLNGKKKWGVDLMVEELAKRKNWSKCPHCRYYVEKSHGCCHIICRCKYEFCYKCGKKWSKKHESCSV